MEHIAKAFRSWFADYYGPSDMSEFLYDAFQAGYEAGYKAASAWEELRRSGDFQG